MGQRVLLVYDYWKIRNDELKNTELYLLIITAILFYVSPEVSNNSSLNNELYLI
jgi:hypothetical protein